MTSQRLDQEILCVIYSTSLPHAASPLICSTRYYNKLCFEVLLFFALTNHRYRTNSIIVVNVHSYKCGFDEKFIESGIGDDNASICDPRYLLRLSIRFERAPSSPQYFICGQQIYGDDGTAYLNEYNTRLWRLAWSDSPGVQHLPFHPIIVPNSLDRRIEWLARLKVDANDVTFRLLVLGNGTDQKDRSP